MTSTVDSVKEKFRGIIKQKNAAAYVIDDVVNNVIVGASAATITNITCGKDTGFVSTAASATLDKLLSTVATVKTAAVQNVSSALLAATCPGTQTIAKTEFIQKLKTYQAKDVSAYPTDAANGQVTFTYTVDGAPKKGTIAMASNNLNTNAIIRTHANGTISYRWEGKEALHTVTVKSVASVQGQANTYNLTFDKAAPAISKPLGVFKLSNQTQAVQVGETAQVFVNTYGPNALVTQFVKWTSRVTSLTVTVSSATKVATPANSYKLEFVGSPKPSKPIAPQVVEGLFFQGDVAKVNVITTGQTTSILGAINWTSRAVAQTAEVKSATPASDQKSTTIVFKDPKTAKEFKPFVWKAASTVYAGDTATIYARQADSTVVFLSKFLKQNQDTSPDTSPQGNPDTSPQGNPDTSSPDTSPPAGPSDKPRDDVTGQAQADTGSPTIKINVNLENDNENREYGGSNGVYLPGYYYTGTETSAPDPTEPPQTTQTPDDDRPPLTYTCPAAPACPKGLSTPGTFFCMTKRTFIIVVVMLLLASLLLGAGYYMYRKKWKGPAANATARGPANGFGDLGDLGGLGGPGGGGGFGGGGPGGSGANFGRS